MKTPPKLSELKKTVQRKVNAYVRLRDSGKPCISCGKPIVSGHAGHYIAQGSSGALRYNLDNVNLQCLADNLFKHGALIEYRIGLVKKIGEKRVKWLEAHRHDIKKWERSELLEIVEQIKILSHLGDTTHAK